jgi:hypothetical protein
MKLCIYTAATRGYGHALTTQARRMLAGILLESRISRLLVVFVTDDEAEVAPAAEIYREGLTALDADVEIIARPFLAGGENYKPEAQLLIAAMRTAATNRAIGWEADLCLALDSDVLPPANALRCMIDMLLFDGGFYGVSFCPYPSQGGGAFLGGRGTPQNPILPDFYEDEKDVPQDLLDRRTAAKSALDASEAPETLHAELDAIEKEIRSLPPRDNVFASNGKQWRRRGWFDFAYPALGRGAIVPTDWTGFGCTMMGRHALALCDFSGYDGRGTEDLYINFRRWYPAGIRMACIPHCPCDHVIRDPKDRSKHVLIMTGHADDEEHYGHLRQWRLPWNPLDSPPFSEPSAPPAPLPGDTPAERT